MGDGRQRCWLAGSGGGGREACINRATSPPIVMTSLPSGNEHSDFLHSLTKLAILNARLFICLPTRSFPHQTQQQQQ